MFELLTGCIDVMSRVFACVDEVRFCALLQFSVLVFCIDSPYPYSAEASL